MGLIRTRCNTNVIVIIKVDNSYIMMTIIRMNKYKYIVHNVLTSNRSRRQNNKEKIISNF